MSNRWNIGDQMVVESTAALHPRIPGPITSASCTFTRPDHTTEVVAMADDAGTWWCMSPVLDMAGAWTWEITTLGAHGAEAGSFTVFG